MSGVGRRGEGSGGGGRNREKTEKEETRRNSGWTILIRILGWNFSQPFLFWEADCQTDKIWRTRARASSGSRESAQAGRRQSDALFIRALDVSTRQESPGSVRRRWACFSQRTLCTTNGTVHESVSYDMPIGGAHVRTIAERIDIHPGLRRKCDTAEPRLIE